MVLLRSMYFMGLLTVSTLGLFACGGGGGGSVSNITTQTLSGVAATGAAMDGAIITITDSKGAVLTKTSGVDGSYSADVTALTPPLVITASKQVGDTTLTLTSVATEKPTAGTSGTVNVTPLTNAAAALIAPNGNPSELLDTTVMTTNVTSMNVNNKLAVLNAAIADVLTDAGLDPAKFNIIATPFTANRAGADRVLELVRVELTGQGVSLTNPSVQDNGLGSSSVKLTPTTTVATASKVPAPPAGTVLGELDHLATLLQTCMADSASVRTPSRNVSGIPTSYSAACSAIPVSGTYKSGGATIGERYKNLLTNDDYTGAKFAKPEALFTNTNGTVFFRMTYRTAAGIGGIILDVAQKTSPAGKSYTWEMVGNQRDYDSSIEVQLDNWNQLNPSVNSGYEYGKSQYLVSFNLFFNPSNTAGLNAQIVRVKGPGLPSNGITMVRSNVCGSDGFMSNANKTGALVDSVNASLLFTYTTGSTFRVSGVDKTGAALTWSKYANNAFFRDTAMTDAQIQTLPSWGAYTWEIWKFNVSGGIRSYRTNITNATLPDETYTQRLITRLPTPSSLKTLTWNTINANDFLNPNSALASQQSSVTVSWKALSEPVNFAYATGQKNVSNGAASITARADSSATGISVSATTKILSPATDTGTGTSTLIGVSGFSSGIIPACASAPSPFPAFDAIAGVTGGTYTYRSLGIRSRAHDLSRRNVLNRWDNNPAN